MFPLLFPFFIRADIGEKLKIGLMDHPLLGKHFKAAAHLSFSSKGRRYFCGQITYNLAFGRDRI